MGFWDFVAPDYETFAGQLRPVLPPTVFIGPISVPREALIANAWVNPFSGSGLAARLYIELTNAGANSTAKGVAWFSLNQQAMAADGGQIIIGRTNAMGQLIIPNVYRVSIEMVAGGRDIINVVHIEGSAGGQEAAAAAAVLAGWKVASGPLPIMTSFVAMAQVVAMDLSSASGGIAVVADSTAGGDTTTNQIATRAACALVKLNGGTRDRSSRGRIYYGPIMEDDLNSDGATLSSSAVTKINTAFTNFRLSLTSAGFTLGVASRLHSTFTSASSHTVESTIATQRRRIRS